MFWFIKPFTYYSYILETYFFFLLIMGANKRKDFFYTFLIKIKHYHSNKRRKCCTNNNIFFYLHLTPTLQKYIRAHTVLIKTYTWADCRKRGFSQSRPAVHLSVRLYVYLFTRLIYISTTQTVS